MSRDDGFAVMDISTSIHEDPKFKRLARRHPELVAPAFLAYVATVAESWREGELVSIEDAWPSLIPYDRAVVAALRRFTLIDRRGCVGAPGGDTWDRWFGPAYARREAARAAGREGNRRRWHPESPPDGVAIASRSGGDPRTVRSVPSVEIPPPPAERGRRKDGTNPRANGTNPRSTGEAPRQQGTSIRQEREDRKRGPTALGAILAQLAEGDS